MAVFKSWLAEGEDLDLPSRSEDLKYVHAVDMADQAQESDEKYRKRVIADWRSAADAKAGHVQDRGDSRAGLPGCVKGIKTFTRDCGHKQAVPLRCGKPTCPECEKLRAREAMARWTPVIRGMKRPKMLVLAIESSQSLSLALELLAWCFARFMDLRLGARAREKYKRLTREFIEAHRAEFDQHHTEDAGRKSADEWLDSCDRFWDVDVPRQAAKKKTAKEDKSDNAQALKVRDLLFGVRALEITWNAASGWHPHFHCAVDSIFLPFPALLVLWMQACTIGEACVASLADPDEELAEDEVLGRTAHISALRNPEEVIKYVTKHQDYAGDEAGRFALPPERRLELEEVLYGKQRIKPLGGAEPQELPQAVCPSCKTPGCKCQGGEVISEYCAGDIWKSPAGEYIRVWREKGKGLMWECLPNADAPLLDTTGNSLTEAGWNFPDPAPSGP